MKRKPSTRKTQRATATKRNQHLPEWDQVFNKLQAEAKDRYPDGRLRIIAPPAQTLAQDDLLDNSDEAPDQEELD